MKYVILEGLAEGNRFFTDVREDADQTKLQDGTIAYKVLAYAETIEAAQIFLYGRPMPLPTVRL